jgi:catechol 2,3-dioxygenase-like lactoylglutathione lyase family enzyme
MLNRIEQLLAMYEDKQIDRRQLIGALFLASAAPLTASPAQPGASQGRQNSLFRGRIINHVTMRVNDLEESRAFYQELLGASVLLDGTASSRSPWYDLRVGESFVSVSKGTPGIDHFAIGIDPWSGADRALEAVQKRFPQSEPRLNQNPLSKAAEIRSVMLKDPSGNSVQLGSTKYQL